MSTLPALWFPHSPVHSCVLGGPPPPTLPPLSAAILPPDSGTFSHQHLPPVDSVAARHAAVSGGEGTPKASRVGTSRQPQTPAESHMWSVRGMMEGQSKEQRERGRPGHEWRRWGGWTVSQAICFSSLIPMRKRVPGVRRCVCVCVCV